MIDEGLNWKGLRRTDPAGPRPLAGAVLRLIWQERRISRAEIARRADLSRSTVSEIVSEILPLGLVSEIGQGPSAGGRRPILLEFKDDASVILGVEMGATHVAVALTDLRGRVLHWESVDHPVRTDPEGTRKVIARLCESCLETTDKPLLGIGVAAPCPIDPAHPNEPSEVVLPDWKGRLGLEPLQEKLGAPLMVDNDANLGALAEQWWGLGRDYDDIAYIKVATGIGSGHVIGGQIYRGSTGVAGEIGHTSVDPKGKVCVCGLRGCLVTLVGGAALLERVKELSHEYPDSKLAGGAKTILELEDAALQGDSLALQIAQEAAGHLGRAVASLLNLMNPSLVVIGGDLARLGELLVQPMRETVQRRTLVSSVSAAAIRTSELGLQSVAIGAATLVLKSALENSNVFRAAVGPSPASHEGPVS